MDAFGYNIDGECTEVEIKVADYDFYKEFSKECKVAKHKSYQLSSNLNKGFCPTHFYFMVLHTFEKRALRKMDAEKCPYGLITYNHSTGQLRLARQCPQLTTMAFTGIVLDTPYVNFQHKRIAI